MSAKKAAKRRSAALQRALLRRKQRKQKRGIALIMVLGAITILTVFLTELQTDTSSALAGALADRDRLKAEYYAKSAVNLSRMLLASEPLIKQDPMIAILMSGSKIPQLPVWEFSRLVLGAFNGGDHARAFGTNVGVDLSTAKNVGIPGKDYFEVKIVDEDSKININTAAGAVAPTRLMQQLAAAFLQPQYATLFEAPDGDRQNTDAGMLCAAMIDWADADETLTNCIDPTQAGGGAEDNSYQMLGFDYRRKNAGYDSFEELRLIRGMDDDRWATFVDPDPSDPKKRLMTVWGQTGVNVNTANAQTLYTAVCAYAAPQTPLCTDPLQAVMFLQGLNLFRSLLPGVPLAMSGRDFKNNMMQTKEGILGTILKSLGVLPVTFRDDLTSGQVKNVFKVKSNFFSIYAEGVVPGTQREARVRIHAVIDRSAPTDWSKVQQPGQNGANTPSAKDSTAPLAGQDPASQNGPVNPELFDQEFVDALKKNPFGRVIYYRVD